MSALKRSSKTKDKLRVISLFSGAGGMDLGLKKSGLKIVWAIDNDPDCVQTYKKNIGGHIVCEDISSIPSSAIPDADLIIGGFPCQGFSMANRFRSSKDQRNILYLEMLRIIKDKQPKWFIAENVKGILSLDKGKVFTEILKDFGAAGYGVNHLLVNMADHGVPQLRKRVIILGTRKDLPDEMTLTHPKQDYNKNGDNKMKTWIGISEALKATKDLKADHLNNSGSKYKVRFRNFTGHRKTNGQLPSPTILARGNGKGGVCAIPHPDGTRRLTVRESALIQTFPIDFEFIGSVNSTYRQIGNAVPVLYSKKLGKEIIRVSRYAKE